MSDHIHSIKQTLEIAESAGLQLTQSRRDLIDLLYTADQPQTAYQLRDMLSHKNGKDVKPVTIYRALDALCESGVVVKIESSNSFVLCKHAGHKHQHAFLVCSKCGTVTELDDHIASAALTKRAKELDFQITRHILELHGLCRDCQLASA